MEKLQGKAAVITGGGTGIGRAVALILADAGVSVAVNYSRSATEAEETAEELRQKGVKAIAVKADVSKDGDVIALFEKAYEEFERIDFLLNSAGYTKFTPHKDLDALTEDLWYRTLDVNLKGTMYCIRQGVKYMAKNPEKRGSIINIAGTTALTGQGSSVVYSASKAGILSLTRSLSRAFAPDIQVNAISPGAVEDTRFCAGQEGFFEMNREATPMQRLCHAQDIAETALFLFSSDHFITGQNINVDGGRVVC